MHHRDLKVIKYGSILFLGDVWQDAGPEMTNEVEDEVLLCLVSLKQWATGQTARRHLFQGDKATRN